MDTQAFRRSLHHSDRYNRRGFDSPTKRAQALEEAYQSDLISSIRDNGFTYTKGRLNIKLAQAFGFCWGVERAVAMAYETRRHYPNENIWITNEIIHNPSVNDHLRKMNVKFISAKNGIKDFSLVSNGDVVILPAFGATVQDMKLLHEKGVISLIQLVHGFLWFGIQLKYIKNMFLHLLFTENLYMKRLLLQVHSQVNI